LAANDLASIATLASRMLTICMFPNETCPEYDTSLQRNVIRHPRITAGWMSSGRIAANGLSPTARLVNGFGVAPPCRRMLYMSWRVSTPFSSTSLTHQLRAARWQLSLRGGSPFRWPIHRKDTVGRVGFGGGDVYIDVEPVRRTYENIYFSGRVWVQMRAVWYSVRTGRSTG